MRLILFLICLNLPFATKDPWILSESSFQKARNEKKLLFIFVGSDVCLETRDYLKEIVSDQEFMGLLKTRFVFSLVDADQNPNLDIRYSLPTIPGFFVMDAEGHIYVGMTKPAREEALTLLRRFDAEYQANPQALLSQLKEYQKAAPKPFPYQTVQEILDSTMNLPNHISLDLGRYILGLPKNDPKFLDYQDQFLTWIKSENYDFVEGSFFMPRGYSTFFAESKYSFFNFKLSEMLIDFYLKTREPEFKQAFLKGLKYIHRDLQLETALAYSTGYASKRYFKMDLKERLLYFPPAPKRFDLSITQILFLKILYKLEILQKKSLLTAEEIDFFAPEMGEKKRQERWEKIQSRYLRPDGLLYFTAQKEFTNFETQIEYFSLLQLMESLNPSAQFLDRMEGLFQSVKTVFFDPAKGLFSDIPLEILKSSPLAYQYPLYQVREHSRLLQFIDFLGQRTKKQSYVDFSIRLLKILEGHNRNFPQRFYWLDWYKGLNQKNKEIGQ